MSRVRFLFLAALTVLSVVCSAVPKTVKELQVLVRVGTPEAEILRDLTARRLVAPLDVASERQLVAGGMSASLMAKIKSGGFTLSPEQAQAEAMRQSANQQAAARQHAEAEAHAQAQAQRSAQFSAQLRARGTMQSWLQDRLVYQEGGNLKPLDSARVGATRVFALYASASWCGPCKKFTPKLVAAYRELKSKYPEFEVVFVSSDRDEFNMTEYMRAFGMPWPALKPKQLPAEMAGFFGDSIPWLVLVGDDGRPLSQNAVDRKYIEPEKVLAGIDGFLAQRRTQGL